MLTYLRNSLAVVAGYQLLAEVDNPLLDQITDPLVGILHGLDLFCEGLGDVLGEKRLVLGRQVVIDLLDHLDNYIGQDFE